ncbi:MAG: hypothetical protein J5605_09720 [Bacteroidales bacterium]|nr:hypothetical protein [Bacteroidales bacterium]
MWFTNLFTQPGVAQTIILLSFTIFAGILLSKIKIKGISLGVTWILFVGIAISAFGIEFNGDMLHLIKEFGLILFVTSVGLQVGPGFFSSFRKGGLAMNLMALVNVGLGVGITVLIAKLTGQSLTEMTGVYTGAITNTPGLGAAQSTLNDMHPELCLDIASGYAVAYPLAVLGMIACCLILRPKNLSAEPTETKEPIVKTGSTASTPSSQRHKINLVPIFVIIAIGIVAGSIPIPVGVNVPVKLGLAGGPLVVAIISSWLGVKKGWFTTELTDSHGVWMLREVGIALFLAGVGLGAGGSFVTTVKVHYMWVVYGVIITMVPPLLVAGFGRKALKMNYYTLMGFIGGSHTDPPTLAFANNMAPEGCKLPNTGYATVYPLTMFLRILSAQLLIIFSF